MNNMLNSNLMGLLAGVDKSKIEKISNMVKNMPREDLTNLINLLGGASNRTSDNQEGGSPNEPCESNPKWNRFNWG